MQPRRVTVTLELETAESLKTLAKADWWNDYVEVPEGLDEPSVTVVQAQANVVERRPGKKTR